MLLLKSMAMLAPILSSAQGFSGFSIPEGQPYGLYSVYLDSNGTQVHTKLVTAPGVASRQLHGAKVRRSSAAKTTITCADGDGLLDPADTDAANADLDRQCNGVAGNFVPGEHNFYAFNGGTVAFFCNFGDDNRCNAVSRAGFSQAITGICGRYHPGWGTVKKHDISYGYDVAWSKFCGTGIDS